MTTLRKKKLDYLLVLFFCSLIMNAQAGETAATGPTDMPPGAAPSAQDGSQPATAETVQQSQPLVLSLGNAVAMAVYRNIDLRIEALNFKMAETDVAKSWGIYNPVFNASGSGGVTAVPGDAFFSAKTTNASIGLVQNLPTGGSISATTQTGFFSLDNSVAATKDWQSTAGLNVTLPLLKNAGRETVEMNITVAANTQQDSLERFRASTIETVSNVITTYNHLYVLRHAQETRVSALNSAQKLLDEIKKKATPGAVQGMELANAEFAIAQRRKDLVEASRSAKDHEVSLRYLIGLDLPTQIIPSDPPSRYEPLETDEQAAKAALEHRSDLKQMQLSLKTSQLQERIARRQSWPDLSVLAGGGFTGTGFNFGESYQQLGNNPGTFWSVGLQFSVPLGNTVAVNEYRKNRIKTEQVQHQIKALSWKIRNDVESDMRALISARLQMQLSDRSRLLAEQRLEEYHKNNQLGSATIQDVLNAENDRNTAHNAHLEAIETFSNAVTKLWKDTGLLLDRHGIHIDTSHPDKLTESKEQNPSLLVDPPASGNPPVAPAALQDHTQNMTLVPTSSFAAASGVAAQQPATDAPEKEEPLLK
ncbi:MAG: TolC family protein [Desulfuromonadales bacterium]|nr:TolC family protein [Desulfuromonadales bacterium]